MALGAVLGAALNTAAPHRYGIYIDGLDVAKDPAAGGNSYGVDVGSIRVREAGSGQVSSMSFTIKDPRAAISVAEGQFVRFHDFTRDMPVFTGFVLDWSATARGVGRVIEVQCIGIETILDWAYVPTAVSVIANAPPTDGSAGYHAAMTAVVAAAVGIDFPLNTRWSSAAGATPTRDLPFRGPIIGFDSVTTFTVGPGSLRQCLMQLFDLFNASIASGGLGTQYGPDTRWFLTIDFYGGVRACQQTVDPAAGMTDVRPADYGEVTLDTSTATRPSGTRYGVTSSGVGGVYVKGAGAGARYVKRSGGIGRVATTGTTAITDAVGAQAAADAYFARNGTVREGTVTAEGTVTMGTDSAQVRAGARITVVDPQVGLPSPGFKGVITGIDKAWASSGEETWTFAFGGQDPRTASSYLRALATNERA